MRNIAFLTLGLVVLFTSCNSIEKFRAPIEELGTSWDSTTAAVTEFVGQLQGEQASAQSMLAQMVVPEGVNLGEEAMAQVDQLKADYTAEVGNLGSLAETVNAFVTQWTEKGNELTTLKDGLAAGKLEGDVMGTINSLKEMVTNGSTNLEGWKAALEASKGKLGEIAGQFSQLIGGAQ